MFNYFLQYDDNLIISSIKNESLLLVLLSKLEIRLNYIKRKYKDGQGRPDNIWYDKSNLKSKGNDKIELDSDEDEDENLLTREEIEIQLQNAPNMQSKKLILGNL